MLSEIKELFDLNRIALLFFCAKNVSCDNIRLSITLVRIGLSFLSYEWQGGNAMSERLSKT